MHRSLKKALFAAASATAAIALTSGAVAFCGFYVAKADTKLFNKASKVAIMRDNDRTVITMANDYQGDLKEFAMVIPVPVVLQEEQIHVTDNAIIDHLDAYTAPRLVEYFDGDPCTVYRKEALQMAAPTAVMEDGVAEGERDSLGVTIEAEYTVGEYDIQILSAEQSGGLAQWLVENGYKLPDGAEATLGSYIKQGTKFFVAKVNLEEQAETGLKYLRPLQIAFESPKFQLPIRLGTVNADGKQELFVFGLTRSGRIETTNYRTVKLPTGMDIPLYVKDEFGSFYKSMFDEQVEKENGRAVFMEYAWNMNWCDPCAADPLSSQELRELGVYWLDNDGAGIQPRRPGPQAQDVYVTRLHVSYDAQTFPEDLVLKETGDKSNFQGRYVLRHPYKGDTTCEAAEDYRANLPKRFEKEAQTLANLTGWNIDDIREKMNEGAQSFDPPKSEPWWKRIWGDDDSNG
ncbi:DUF2330 domain-containing protein [Hyphococcus flavus]|uniref:DUF2330 domain-containing protein n=1 Tax=Hyphococcus flavus TaxID=1866326 RepID=A0AAE9ZAC6_9PROT|nr:DUF2330 domain-containing protein [Hyphococcus flavus]WDI30594.1 DUF2330 domain-containing protein [Hyphococcus flavus]